MQAEPQEEHRWLQKLVGEWEYEMPTGADPSSETLIGTETVRSLDGIWIVAEGRGDMPGGGAATMITTLGYDPRRKHYVGTWIGSMMDYLWVYDGELDASGTKLTLSAEGPAMDAEGKTDPDGKTAQYRDVIEFLSDDHRTLAAYVQGDDGEWSSMMTVHYRRTSR